MKFNSVNNFKHNISSASTLSSSTEDWNAPSHTSSVGGFQQKSGLITDLKTDLIISPPQSSLKWKTEGILPNQSRWGGALCRPASRTFPLLSSKGNTNLNPRTQGLACSRGFHSGSPGKTTEYTNSWTHRTGEKRVKEKVSTKGWLAAEPTTF